MAQHHAHHHGTESADSNGFTTSRLLTGLAIGGVAAGAALILAPHLLPALGVTSAELSQEAALMLHHEPSGIAGDINSVLKTIPLIGTTLAEGGLFTAATSATISIGGLLASHFLEKREDGSNSIRWSRVIKYGALITSALIALPTLLTAIGTGIIYLGMAAEGAGHIAMGTSTTTIIPQVAQTVGTIGGNHQHLLIGSAGLLAAIPHLFTCGASLFPAALTVRELRKDKQDVEAPAPESFRERIMQQQNHAQHSGLGFA